VKENDSIETEKFKKKEGSGINKDVFVFAFFLLLSFVFWYLNSLGKDIEADIKYELKYINIPSQREIAEDTPGKLSINLKGSGYAIMKLKLTSKSSPLKIDISKVNYKKVPESTKNNFLLVTSGLTKSFKVQLGSEFEIIAIKPDTLFFTLDKQISNLTSPEPETKSLIKSKK
jgi:hypothetical protein